MIKITPGQALLLLIDKYQKNPDLEPPLSVETMKRLYLSGATNIHSLKKIRSLYSDVALNGYEISEGYSSLYKDPTRRYFETHLAYQTQSLHIGDISIKRLRTYASTLFTTLPERAQKALPSNFLSAGIKFAKGALKKEYQDALERLQTEPNLQIHLKGAKLEKAELLIKCCLMGVISGHYIKTVVDVHQTGFYHKSARGRISKAHRLLNLRHYGLLRSTMPLSRTDLAFSSTKFKISKPSENSRYDKNAAWPQYCFAHLTQSFSNSISGTNLRQAQIMAHLISRRECPFDDARKIIDYFKLMISSLMFISGGHTLFEFSSPLFIPEVMEHFSSIPGTNAITFESLFLDNNVDAFELAITRAIKYNSELLSKQKMLVELQSTCIAEESPKAEAGSGIRSGSESVISVRDRIEKAAREAMSMRTLEEATPAIVSLQHRAAKALTTKITHINRNATPATVKHHTLKDNFRCVIQ